jgi:hypothetical protein
LEAENQNVMPQTSNLKLIAAEGVDLKPPTSKPLSPEPLNDLKLDHPSQIGKGNLGNIA